MQEFGTLLRELALKLFLQYARIDTASDDQSEQTPSTSGQLVLARKIAEQLEALNVRRVSLDARGYLYGQVPASDTAVGPPISFCAHLDTSPAESGKGVKPVLHSNYSGGVIRFQDDDQLLLSDRQSPELQKFIGDTIITSTGSTLLGADDKAGVAAIMAAVTVLQQNPRLKHPEIRLVFTPDEEIGRGTDHIQQDRLGKYGYTIDGGMLGELEAECFDAREAVLVLHGRNIHPGFAKGRMLNAAAIASRLVAALPEYDTPEHSAGREGFWHLMALNGNENKATVRMILRDFRLERNDARIDLLQQVAHAFELRHPGLRVTVKTRHQYRNMREVLDRYPKVVQLAEEAITRTGLPVIRKPVRGGTDGARLSFMGMPCPNIFSGAMMIHSKTEWLPVIALQKAAEVILQLCHLWAENR